MSTTKPTDKAQAACWRKLAFTLKQQTKMTWQQIADALNNRGYHSAKGSPLTNVTVKTRYTPDHGQVLSDPLPSEWDERFQRDLKAIFPGNDPSEHDERSDHLASPGLCEECAERGEQNVPGGELVERGERDEQASPSPHSERPPDVSSEERHDHSTQSRAAAEPVVERKEPDPHSEQEAMPLLSEQDRHSPQTRVSQEPAELQGEPSPHSEPLTLDRISEHLIPIMRDIAKEVCESMMHHIPNDMHVPGSKEFPEPTTLKGTERGGRRETRAYEKLSATIDQELYKLFDADRAKRPGYSVGRMLDYILWSHYGKPPLSSQLEGAEDRAKARPKRPKKVR
jgi:hypothetical protein